MYNRVNPADVWPQRWWLGVAMGDIRKRNERNKCNAVKLCPGFSPCNSLNHL